MATQINQNPNLQLPPLRSLDDFLLGSARFQLPAFRDLDKWANRVVKNLLYYQTNYILTFLATYIIMGILYPGQIFCGLIVKFMIIAIFIGFFPDRGNPLQQNKYRKWYYLGATLFVGYLLLLWYDALLLSAFTILLPFALTFIHSSLRLRSIRNKLVNTQMEFGGPTPMGIFLTAMNITVENILS